MISSPLARLFGRGAASSTEVIEPVVAPEVNVFDEDAQRDLLREELSEIKERMQRLVRRAVALLVSLLFDALTLGSSRLVFVLRLRQEMLLMSLTKGIRSDSM